MRCRKGHDQPMGFRGALPSANGISRRVLWAGPSAPSPRQRQVPLVGRGLTARPRPLHLPIRRPRPRAGNAGNDWTNSRRVPPLRAWLEG